MIAAFVLVAVNASTAPSSPTQAVVVAANNLPPRIPIEAASLVMKNVPTTSYQQAFFTRIDDVKGTIPLVTIVAGQPITSNLVAKPSQALGSQSEFLPIPSGYVALTIPTNEEQGVGGYIQPDDYIAIIATVSSAAKIASLTIFANVHVIRVGSQGANSGTTAPASSLTILVTQCQAEYITWFLINASLKYTLESYRDYLQGSPTKDPQCPGVTSAKGVTQDLVQKTFPTLF